MRKHPLGIYEKALPHQLSWPEKLAVAKACGYDFVEMSVDESDERLARLEWTREQRFDLVKTIYASGMRIMSLCLSGHRRFPFGSRDARTRAKAHEIMEKGIKLAVDLGVRNIQLAGYDVYYEEPGKDTAEMFAEGLEWAVARAAANQVVLSMEIMDTEFMNSITKWKRLEKRLSSPWFCVYPDIGNLTAWNNDVEKELALGMDRITSIHLKDTLKVKPGFPGLFRDLPFGKGEVDFPLVFRTLKKLNYRGAFLVEMWTEKSPEPLAELIKARQWLEARMYEAEFPI